MYVGLAYVCALERVFLLSTDTQHCFHSYVERKQQAGQLLGTTV